MIKSQLGVVQLGGVAVGMCWLRDTKGVSRLMRGGTCAGNQRTDACSLAAADFILPNARHLVVVTHGSMIRTRPRDRPMMHHRACAVPSSYEVLADVTTGY